MKPNLVIFRPGTLGDQIVLLSVLQDTDLSRTHNLILVERKILNRVSAVNFSYFRRFYSQLFTYSNLIKLVINCINIRFRYGSALFLYIPHSARSRCKVILENIVFSLFFDVKVSNITTFMRYTNSACKFVPEYERVENNIKAVFKDIKFSKKKLVSSDSNTIVIAPRSAWLSKDWPVENFRELVKTLAHKGFNINLVGTTADRLEEFIDYEDNIVVNQIQVLCDSPLEEVESVLLSSKLFVGVDSAVCHLAASAGLPSVILFSDTNRAENWCPPYEHVTAIRKTVDCGGCFSAQCLNIEHSCMSLITVPEVLEVISEKLLK
jgi:ADP-heptose:LPS heptosyltransferase